MWIMQVLIGVDTTSAAGLDGAFWLRAAVAAFVLFGLLGLLDRVMARVTRPRP